MSPIKVDIILSVATNNNSTYWDTQKIIQKGELELEFSGEEEILVTRTSYCVPKKILQNLNLINFVLDFTAIAVVKSSQAFCNFTMKVSDIKSSHYSRDIPNTCNFIIIIDRMNTPALCLRLFQINELLIGIPIIIEEEPSFERGNVQEMFFNVFSYNNLSMHKITNTDVILRKK